MSGGGTAYRLVVEEGAVAVAVDDDDDVDVEGRSTVTNASVECVRHASTETTATTDAAFANDRGRTMVTCTSSSHGNVIKLSS
jgi:anti-sigma factor ChrR (cupin superfamily)